MRSLATFYSFAKPSAILFVAIGLFGTSCTRTAQDNPAPTQTEQQVLDQALSDFGTLVAEPNYADMHTEAIALNAAVQDLANSPTQAKLITAQNAWRKTRHAWEQTEAFLFGPLSTENIDPGIDTWPVNRIDLDSLLQTNQPLTKTFVASQQEGLKGFHPLEYILFGSNASRSASELTQRDLEYAIALAGYLTDMTAQMHGYWAPSNAQSYAKQLSTAGRGSTQYSTQRDAWLEIANAMAEICEEVGDGKIKEPFDTQDPNLEESPFSGNSLTDFTDNMKGVRNAYTCSYRTQGTSLSSWVQRSNKDLDTRIRQQIEVAIGSLQAIPGPFGTAIISNRNQVQTAMTQIMALHTLLEDELTPLIQQRIK